MRGRGAGRAEDPGVGRRARARRSTVAPKYDLVVADVDGTLVGRDHLAVRPRVIAAIAAATRAGARVILCTGRPMASLIKLAAPLGLRGPHIAFDGALVASMGESPVFSRGLPDEAAASLVRAARDVEVCVEIYKAEAHYIERDWPESRVQAELIQVWPQITDLDEIVAAGGVVKGQLIGDGEDGRRRIQSVEALGLPVRFGWATPPPGHKPLDYVNVTHPEVNKGAALHALMEHLGVASERVIALGDGPNDTPLLEAAGLGVAMGNAVEGLKSIADVVVASVEEDGMADAIERYVL